MHLHLERALIECVRRVNMQKALSFLSRATQTNGTPDQGYVGKILQVLILSHIPYYRKYKHAAGIHISPDLVRMLPPGLG